MEPQFIRACGLASGGGSTIEAIYRATQGKASVPLENVELSLVIASKKSAGVLERMRRAGMDEKDLLVLPQGWSKDQDLLADFILEECAKRNVNLIGQWGWLVKTPAKVIQHFHWGLMMVNQHPGPLDPRAHGYDFGGDGMYGRRVTAARMHFCHMVGRDFWTEATAHHVTAEYDQGAVIGRTRLDFDLKKDTVDSLQSRMLPVEHRLQIEVLQDFANGTVEIVEREPHYLVHRGEEEILAQAKEVAIEEYPTG